MAGKPKKSKKDATAGIYSPGQDLRLDFIFDYVTRSLKCKMDKWIKFLTTIECKTALIDFLEEPEQLKFILYINSVGILTISESYPTPVKTKSCYFIKKLPVSILKEAGATIKDKLIYGDLAHQPLENLVGVVEDVISPMISVDMYEPRWPETVVLDVRQRTQEISGVLRSIQGQLKGKTWLPLPLKLETLLVQSSHENEGSNGANDDSGLELDSAPFRHELETIVVKWSQQISEVLHQDSSELFNVSHPASKAHPTPNSELLFWEHRVSDLQCIFDQLNSPPVVKLGSLLKSSKSNYWRCFNSMHHNIAGSLEEAKSILVYLKPLRRHIEALTLSTFDNLPELLRPFMHSLCFLWVYSPHYRTASRIIILLKMICNLIIEMARIYLSGSLVFQVEAEEGWAKSKLVVSSLEFFRELYEAHKLGLFAYFEPGDEIVDWDFMPNLVFERFDRFLDKMKRLEGIFETTVEFYKLDKVEIGGSMGKTLGSQIFALYDDFQEYFQKFSSLSYDCSDPEDNSFEQDALLFDQKVYDIDQRLSYVIIQAMDDAHVPESAFKLVTVLGSLLQRPIIKADFQPKYQFYIQLIEKDIDLLMDQFHEYCAGVEDLEDSFNININGKMAVKNFQLQPYLPPYSALTHWVKDAMTRITTAITQFQSLELAIEKEGPGIDLLNKYDDFMKTMKDFQYQTFSSFCQKMTTEAPGYWLEKILKFESMSDNIIDRNKHKGNNNKNSKEAGEKEKEILVVNLNPGLASVFKEVKYLNMAGFSLDEMPSEVVQLYRRKSSFRKNTIYLNRICQWYNQIYKDISEVELTILKNRLDKLKTMVMEGTEKITWRDGEDIERFIGVLLEPTKKLQGQLEKSKENLRKLEELINGWQNPPLFTRLHNSRFNLLQIEFERSQSSNTEKKETKPNFIQKRYEQILKVSKEIHRLVRENEDLLRNTDSQNTQTLDETPLQVEVENALVNSEISQVENRNSKEVSDEMWNIYLDSIDSMILDGLIKTMAVSLGYLIDHTDAHLTPSPFLQVTMGLRNGDLAFDPALDANLDNSFEKQVESIVDAIYHRAKLIPRVKNSNRIDYFFEDEVFSENNYFEEVCQNEDLQDMHSELISRARLVVQHCFEYIKKFERFRYLYEEGHGDPLQAFPKLSQEGTEKNMDQLPTLMDQTQFDSAENPNENQNQGDVLEEPATLEQFKFAIDTFETILVEVEAFDSVLILENWFRLDMRPFKESLKNQVKGWSLMFKQYLIDSVIGGLSELESFIKVTEVGLQQGLSDGDLQTLISVMGLLHQIKQRTKTTDVMFGPIKEYIELLKTYDYELPESVFVQLEDLPEKWAQLKKQAYVTRVQVAPLQASEVSSIRKRILEFDAKQVAHREMFNECGFFDINCPFPYHELNIAEREVCELETEYQGIFSAAKLFEVSVPDPRALKQCRKELRLAKSLWDFVNILDTTIEDWKMSPWQKVNAEMMDMECKRMAKEVKSMDKDVKQWPLFLNLEATIRNIISSLKSVSELQNPNIRRRHWQELLKSTKIMPRLIDRLIDKFVKDETTTLADLYGLNLHNFEEEVKNVVDKAVKESSMEKILEMLNSTWAVLEYGYEFHPRTGTQLISVSEELIEVLEDNQVQLQNIAMSKYIAFFHEEVESWQNKLLQADNVLSTAIEVQRTWCHLESIFIATDDIRRNLPEDSARFDKIDQDFKSTLTLLYNTKNVIEGTNQPEIFPRLEAIQKELAVCEKALANYLETKRLKFPRFYFVSSADLLDILSSGNEPSQVGRHLTKLFDSICALQFTPVEPQTSSIPENLQSPKSKGKPRHIPVQPKFTKVAHAMKAKDGEIVEFVELCECIGAVEIWLCKLEQTMRSTICHYLRLSVYDYPTKARELWISDYMAQVALCGTQIWWTTEVNANFTKLEDGYENALKDYYKKQVSQLNTLIDLLLGELTSQERQKIMTIATIDVHSRDVVGKLIQMRIESGQAFQWQSQLRHRWEDETRNCYSNICDAQLRYLNEYLGNTPRLVITPLTDRCYITLTQSLHLVMGGAPAGPAGTGKTETTKDLGRALGVMVYVFNCSEQMDYKSIGSIFKGLSMTGAWGCFDEFNRISVEVLSVVAVQVKSMQDAIRDKKLRFNFMGEEISLVDTVGVFITMNPGYAGRSELPENLKVLFRPCAMVVPDFELICEIMLVAEGFQDARLLARKFITLYTLCKELLSKQEHYDWGLRAIKSVLVVAGSLKRGDPGRPEDEVLMRALRDFNVPKIISDDIPIFLGLIGDLFPALEVPRKRDIKFEKSVKEAAAQLKLQAEENFILKVVQLQELLDVRHSVFILGHAGTGKSKVWKTLHKTYQNMGKKPMYDDLNPKAVTNDELFGIINAQREWRDGILSVLMREQANSTVSDGPKWIILDGDIDPMWIESLNTVMDDNKVLTLASNERIALTKSMRLLFEIYTLKHATPATVSRAGILYLNPQDLGWNAYVTSWISQREDANEKSVLTLLFEKYVPSVQEVMRHRFKKITPIPEINHIQLLCHLLEALLTEENTPPDCPKEWIEKYFVFACIWAFASACYQDQSSVDHRAEFSKWWMAEWKFVAFPNWGTVFDYFIEHETKKLLPWSDIIPRFELDPDIPLQAALVHTVETIRLKYFMDLLVDKGQPMMLVGSAGSGKTVLVNDKLAQLPEHYAVANVPFNFYTTSEMLQRVLEKPLEKKAGKNFGPVGNKKLIYFIDDLNMPMVDKYETVQPHTLIRQHIDYRHWYDRTKITLKEINNVQYVACMNPTAGSFTINPRLQRHFAVFSVGFPGQDSLQTIYKTILHQHILMQIPLYGSIHKVVSNIVSAALSLHTRVSQTFIPTAAKFHYVFNLRDLSNVFQGILFANYECLRTPVDLVRIWMHESTRVYGDKLVDDKDIGNFQKFVFDVFKKYFEEMDESTAMVRPLIYYHFALGPGESKYMPVPDFPSLQKFLVDSLKTYNEFNSIMNLVLFDAAIHYVCRISRILESPRGNALLCGVGGSGKQSLARLAAYLSGLDVFQVTLRKGYGIPELKADLAALYIKAGQKNLGTMFLMTDAQVAEEVFLVLINDMLASGEIPDLLPDDEVENVIGSMRSEVKGFGLQDTRENCWKFFIDRVRKVLKCVLCFSPVGSTLRNRSRKFPAVVNCTSIIWFREWPEDALISVSERFVQDIQVLPPDLHTPIASFLAYVHMSVSEMSKVYLANEKRYNYTTPKSYLEQIACYSKLVTQKNHEVISKVNRLEQGLIKLESCAEQVECLKKTLAVQEVVLKEKNDKADELIKIVGEETDLVTKEKENAAREETNVAIVAGEVAKIQEVCQIELEKAEPALQAAYAALNTLNKTNLTELKTFTTPPVDVVNVVAAVFILWEGTQKGRLPRDKSWKVTKSQMMGDVGRFLEGLQNLNKENITPMIVDALKPYINDPGFQPDLIRAKSYAASGLCSYVINVLKFNEVFQFVAPKRKALEEATDELNSNLDKLAFLKATIEKLEEKLAILTKEFEAAIEAKVKCQAEADKTTATIDLANRLVGGLASEKIRWIQNVKILKESMVTIPGDILLVTAFVSYVGSFTKKYRLDLLEKTWVPYLRKMNPGIPMSENVDPLMVLTDEAQIAEWNANGLPSDRMSSENATILVNSQRFPLMIDPQLQGIKWIKNIFKNQLRVIQLGQKGYLEVIEEEITKGGVVLIENIRNSVDPVLEPLLARNLIKKGTAIKIGDKEVDYNPNFRLILQTKLANPHYQPEMQAQTTLINFTVTRDGLEDQLLAEVVKVERPDLEAQKSQLTRQQNEFNILLKELEDDLLSRLQSAKGNFLDDTSLVENLETTKKTAQEVEVKAKEAIITTADIDAAREWYRPAAARASLLYFILNDLNKIHPIYQFSLKAFSTVFHNAIKIATLSSEVKRRTEHLIDAITYSVWLYTTRGLFEGDKLIFTAQMAFQIYRHKIRGQDLDFLLRFPIIPNVSSPVDFISNSNWGAIKSLAVLDDYRGIDRDIEYQTKRWRKFVESDCPEKEPFPPEWRGRTGVQRLCIMRCLRSDRMTYAVCVFVEETLGSKYVKSIRLDFAKSFQETSKETPIFFILSPGVDPLKDVESLGKVLNFTTTLGNFHNVSLGQGQEVVAENALDVAGREGHWVILQNIHLVAKWLPKLEKKLEKNWADSKDTYRVFLSAEPASTHEGHIIPQGILESSIKITNEAPTGMKNNIHKALDNFNQETLETCSKELEFKAILFSLCYFHAVVAERRKFGTQGWNKMYPFNTGDLTISVNVLFNYLEANSKVPWEDLRYLFGEIMYGGHITDDWDRKLCRTYLEEFMVQELLDGEIEYAPGFPAPPSTDFLGYHQYIDELLPPESPYLYGLHPNAEIGFLTATSDTLFKTILELQPRDTGASGGATATKEDKLKHILEEVLDRLPEPWNMLEVYGRAEEKTPYVIVALQECERMNMLTILMRQTLKDLELGLKGELTITGEMEDLGDALFMDQVPPVWLNKSYPTTLGLGSWYADLLLRVRELDLWSNDFLLPPAVWLSGFFNPQSFLTAIMQSTARRQELPLDKMCLQCDVTKKTKEETTLAPKEGACIHGLFMEGARWDMMSGSIVESRPKDLYPPMPVIFLKAITQDKQDTRNMYECPVYKTRARGLNYVWTFNLRTKDKPSKWVLSGVAILLQV